MARVWVYDRMRSPTYAAKAEKAKAIGRKPPGRWQVSYYDKAGKQRVEIYQNKSKAESRRGELDATLQSGTYVDPVAGKTILAGIAEKWIESRHDLKPTTWWKYRSLLDNHVLPQWGNRRLDAIESEDISAWIGTLLLSKKNGGSGLGPSQARHTYRVLSMVLGWCVPARLPRNPATGVKLPIPPETEHVYLTYEQVEACGRSTTVPRRPRR
ncbi:MAG: hypothetical protein ACRDQ5_20750 [Sciscionella sp.]